MPPKSDIWIHFKISTSDKSKAICKYCKKEISRGGKTSRDFNTSNLRNHFSYNHQREVEGLAKVTSVSEQAPSSSATHPSESPQKRLKQYDLKHFAEKHTTWKRSDPRCTEADKSLVKLICLDMQPASIVDDKGFQQFVKTLQPRYCLPGRKDIMGKQMPEMLQTVKTKVQDLLLTAERIAVTTDLWTSGAGGDFISITAHFINEEWGYTHLSLEVMPFCGANHTGDLIAENIRAALSEWGIQLKVKTVVSDSAANMVNAISQLNGTIHIPCVQHRLQLVVKNGCMNQPAVMKLTSNAKRIVSHFHMSVASTKMLKEAQLKYSLPQHMLIKEEPTRWDSCFDMLERLVEQQEAVQNISRKIPGLHTHLTPADWTLAEEVIELLHMFKEATLSLSSDNCMTSDVIPLINSLDRGLRKIKLKKVFGLKAAVTEMLHSLTDRFKDIEENMEVYAAATILDPRYKNRVFKDSAAAKKAVDWLREQILLEVDQIKTPVKQPKEKLKSPLQEICSQLIAESTETCVQALPPSDEMTKYISEANIPLNDCPLSYWKANSTFPNLKTLAKLYLGIPPASVHSERLFSSAGGICTNKRNRLTPEHIQMLTFLHKNITFVD